MRSQKRIWFIEPHGREGRPYNAWLRHWPLLGPITLATILEHRGYDAAVYNENFSGPLEESPEIYQEIGSGDMVGISIMTATASRGYALAQRIRRDFPRVRIVFGGVHATFLPEEALQYGDIVVRGEAENIIEAIARGEIAPGIHHPPPPEDLDAIPPLNHFLIHGFSRMLRQWGRQSIYKLPLAASRGCPHGCTYCSITGMFGQKVRRQSIEKTIHDLSVYIARGFQRIFFYDDNFASDHAWTTELLERMAPLKMRFNAQVRADCAWADPAYRQELDQPMLRAMRRAGVDVLYIGYETLDDETARQWHKGYRGDSSLRERMRQDTQILHDHGAWVHGMFVLGPQHTLDHARGIVDFARQTKIETLQISILTPLPGTRVYDEMRPHLVFTQYPGDWDYYDGTHCIFSHGRLEMEEMQTAVFSAHRRFYRWCVNFRRIRALLQEHIGLGGTWETLRGHIRIARNTMREWKQETQQFLEEVRLRKRQLLRPGRGISP